MHVCVFVQPQGSYICSDCRPGYIGHGSTGCNLSDACLADVHHCAMADGCINTGSGTYKCEVSKCPQPACILRYWCAVVHYSLDPLQQCPEGYLGDGEVECRRDTDDDGVPDQPFRKLCKSPPCKKVCFAWRSCALCV